MLTADDLVFFASTSARARDVEADLQSLPLSRRCKTLQGQVLFASSAPAPKLAALLCGLATVDYVHVLLASCPVHTPGGLSGLDAIRNASEGVSPALFDRAISLWREMCRLDGRTEIADIPTDQLVVRLLGKRGGRGHDFSSDEAKRAAKEGFTQATGIQGSTSTFDFEVLCQVHKNRVWLGLRLNAAPLAPRMAANGSEDRKEMLQPSPSPQDGNQGIVDRPMAPSATARPTQQADRSSLPVSTDAEPPLLSGWMASRLAELGLERPRDVRDAVAPLWELSVEEQLSLKQAEMKALSDRLTSDLERRPSFECEAIRSVSSEGWGGNPSPMRNTCEFHIGHDREGNICCGFRLGLASSSDALAIGPPDRVPFVPGWMSAIATAVGEELRAFAQSSAAAPHLLPYEALRLRGSVRRQQGAAVLVRSHSTREKSRNEDSLHAKLLEGMRAAAAKHGMVLEVVEREANGTVLRPLGVEAGSQTHGNHGVIEEVLRSGLKLRISPLAFFQASTDAAEVLFRTVVEFATDGGKQFPSLLFDLCCGGGVLGLEVARAAADARMAATRVVGIERDADAVRDALANAAANELFPPLYTAHAGTVEDILPLQLLRQQQSNERGETGTDLAGEDTDARRPIVAVLDPPRTGLAPSVCKLLRAQTDVSKIVFVSCNPHGHTLRRDYVVKGGSLGNNLRILCGPRGHGRPFRIEKVVPVDLFVHTPHVELVVLAVRT